MFRAYGEWSQIPHPLGDEECDYNEGLKNAGYEPWHSWGTPPLESSVEVYRRYADDSHFVCLNTPSFFIEVVCENTIAFLEFMRLYGQMWTELALNQNIGELIEEVRNLLIDPQCGIFRDEVREVAERREDQRKYYESKRNQE
jgi:hypothetical protein